MSLVSPFGRSSNKARVTELENDPGSHPPHPTPYPSPLFPPLPVPLPIFLLPHQSLVSSFGRSGSKPRVTELDCPRRRSLSTSATIKGAVARSGEAAPGQQQPQPVQVHHQPLLLMRQQPDQVSATVLATWPSDDSVSAAPAPPAPSSPSSPVSALPPSALSLVDATSPSGVALEGEVGVGGVGSGVGRVGAGDDGGTSMTDRRVPASELPKDLEDQYEQGQGDGGRGDQDKFDRPRFRQHSDGGGGWDDRYGDDGYDDRERQQQSHRRGDSRDDGGVSGGGDGGIGSGGGSVGVGVGVGHVGGVIGGSGGGGGDGDASRDVSFDREHSSGDQSSGTRSDVGLVPKNWDSSTANTPAAAAVAGSSFSPAGARGGGVEGGEGKSGEEASPTRAAGVEGVRHRGGGGRRQRGSLVQFPALVSNRVKRTGEGGGGGGKSVCVKERERKNEEAIAVCVSLCLFDLSQDAVHLYFVM